VSPGGGGGGTGARRPVLRIEAPLPRVASLPLRRFEGTRISAAEAQLMHDARANGEAVVEHRERNAVQQKVAFLRGNTDELRAFAALIEEQKRERMAATGPERRRIRDRNLLDVFAGTAGKRRQTLASSQVDRAGRHEKSRERRQTMADDTLQRLTSSMSMELLKDRSAAIAAARGGGRGSDKADRANEWLAVIVATAVVARRCGAALAVERREQEERMKKMGMSLAVGHLVGLQRWWRRVHVRIMYQRKVNAATLLSVWFGSMNRIKVGFAVALHSLRGVIVKLQRRYRMCVRARALRVTAARRLLAATVDRECHAVDRAAELLFKKRSILEAKLASAIRNRKAHFEQQLRDNQTLLQETVNTRTVLGALTEQSKRRLVEGPLRRKAAAYREALLEFGRDLAGRKTQVDDAKRMMEAQRELMRKQQGGGGGGGGPLLHADKNFGLFGGRDVPRPVGVLGIHEAEMRALVQGRGMAMGRRDFRRDVLGHDDDEEGAALDEDDDDDDEDDYDVDGDD
jgi:hypothetical protein